MHRSQEPRHVRLDGPAQAYPPASQRDEPDQLRDQFQQLFRYRALVLLGLLLGLLGGAWLGVVGNGSYAAVGEVTLRQPTVDPFAAGGKPADAGISIESERQAAMGSAVTKLAAARLGERGEGEEGEGANGGARLQSGLEVTNPPETTILRFTYTADSADGSADRANAFARAFLDNREKETKAQVEKMLDRYRDQRRPLLGQRGRSDSVDAQLAVLDSKIADLTALDTTSGTVVRSALPPTSPAGPGLPMLTGLGAAAGLLLGLLAAWVRLVFDPAARSAGDVVRALGAPVLGTLPHRRRAGPLLATGRTAEEYRS
ncbi:MAG: lipopolysaccharide biosynthesis protein, partial [Streptomyces sp.]